MEWLKIACFVFLISLNECVQFPKDWTNMGNQRLQQFITALIASDTNKPDFCNGQIDYENFSPLIHLTQTSQVANSPYTEAFMNAYESYKTEDFPANVANTYLTAIFDSGPMQLLNSTFFNARHDFFFNKMLTRPRTKGQIVSDLTSIWDSSLAYPFKHVFFGEKRHLYNKEQHKNFAGLHSWLGFWKMESEGRVYVEEILEHRYDVATKIKFHYKDDREDSIKWPKFSIHSFLMNKSPEFEIALYTALALYYAKSPGTKTTDGLKVTTDSFDIDGCSIRFAVLYLETKNGRMLKSAYPDNLGPYKDCKSGYIARLRAHGHYNDNNVYISNSHKHPRFN